MVERDLLSTEGLNISKGDTGLRVALEGLALPAFIEFPENLEVIVVSYANMVQVEYDHSGQLLTGGIWLGQYWNYQKLTQPLIWPTGVLEETLSDIGLENVMVNIDLLNGFKTGLVGVLPSGEVAVLPDEVLLMQGDGSAQDPLVGLLGQRGVRVAIVWDDESLKMGVGESSHVRMMPMARKVRAATLFGNLNKTTVSDFITKALPRIRLFSEEE